MTREDILHNLETLKDEIQADDALETAVGTLVNGIAGILQEVLKNAGTLQQSIADIIDLLQAEAQSLSDAVAGDVVLEDDEDEEDDKPA
jgi:hypothetical protein